MGKAKRMWDNYQEIAFVPKSLHQRILVAAAIRGGIKYINLREFYLRKRDNVWRPGREGIAIPIEFPMLLTQEGVEEPLPIIVPIFDKLQEVIGKTMKYLETMPLYDKNKAIYYNEEDRPNANTEN